jgi:hypothetical protein
LSDADETIKRQERYAHAAVIPLGAVREEERDLMANAVANLQSGPIAVVNNLEGAREGVDAEASNNDEGHFKHPALFPVHQQTPARPFLFTREQEVCMC